MSAVNVALWVAGIVLIAIGYVRWKGPWARYQALKDQDANEARYNAWRGGVREPSTTGAAVAMEVFRRQWQTAIGIVVVGVVLVILGFAIK